MEYIQDREIPGYKKLDINYDMCDEGVFMKGNISKKEISDIIAKGLEGNMEKEPLDYSKKCNIKRIYHISIRNLENNEDITEIVSDTGNRELTDDILTEILGELEDPRLFGMNDKYDS